MATPTLAGRYPRYGGLLPLRWGEAMVGRDHRARRTVGRGVPAEPSRLTRRVRPTFGPPGGWPLPVRIGRYNGNQLFFQAIAGLPEMLVL